MEEMEEQGVELTGLQAQQAVNIIGWTIKKDGSIDKETFLEIVRFSGKHVDKRNVSNNDE